MVGETYEIHFLDVRYSPAQWSGYDAWQLQPPRAVDPATVREPLRLGDSREERVRELREEVLGLRSSLDQLLDQRGGR